MTTRKGSGGGRYTPPAPRAEIDDEDDFDAPQYRGQSYTFKLGGRLWHCRSEVTFGFIEKQLAMFDKAAEERELAEQAAAGEETDEEREQREKASERSFLDFARGFLSAVIVPEEVEDFLVMIDRPDGPLHTGNLWPLMTRITAKLTNRDPTKPGSSAAGQQPMPRRSGASSRSRAGRPKT